jgi:large subunit ribosomal protein L28
MSRVCAVTKKKVMYGNKVSHSNRKTRTRYEINLQPCSFPSELLGRAVRLRLTPNGIRTVEKNGGIDAWLLGAKPAALDSRLKTLKKRLAEAQARKK